MSLSLQSTWMERKAKEEGNSSIFNHLSDAMVSR